MTDRNKAPGEDSRWIGTSPATRMSLVAIRPDAPPPPSATEALSCILQVRLAIKALTHPPGEGMAGPVTLDVDFGISIGASGGAYGSIRKTLAAHGVAPVGSGASQRLRLEYVRMKVSSNPGITYIPQFSSNLQGSGTGGWTAASGPETLESIDTGWERVVVEDIAGTGGIQRFGRVKVTSP